MTAETRGNDGAGLHEIMTEALTRIGFDTRSLGILCGLRKRSQQLLWLPWGDLGKPRSHASEKKKKKKGRETETNLPSTCTDMSAVTHAVLRSRLLVTVDPGRMGNWGEMTEERSVLVRLGCCN